MPASAPPNDLIDHLCRSSALSSAEAHGLIEEILAFYAETPEIFIRRRHHEMQSAGLNNAAIFCTIQNELQDYRFVAPTYSERQIRRAIYG